MKDLILRFLRFLGLKRRAAFRTSAGFACDHGASYALKIRVFDILCSIGESPMCVTCTERYLNLYSTLCGSCNLPILPGTKVGQARMGSFYEYTHLTERCSPHGGGRYCGVWGEGKIITLHELDPKKYVSGTATLSEHLAHKGRVFIPNKS